MKNYFYSFILLLLSVLVVSCATNSYKNLHATETKTIDSTLLRVLFKNTNPAPLYKTDVTLYGKKFGGLLLVKYMPDSSYRIVFTNETGVKFFDMEWKHEKFTVHYCMDKFNRDAVLTTIASDIKLVITEYKQAKTAAVLADATTEFKIYKFNSDNVQEYYFCNASNNELSKIEQAEGKKKKVIVNLSTYKNLIPSLITIEHKNIRLKIELHLLER